MGPKELGTVPVGPSVFPVGCPEQDACKALMVFGWVLVCSLGGCKVLYTVGESLQSCREGNYARRENVLSSYIRLVQPYLWTEATSRSCNCWQSFWSVWPDSTARSIKDLCGSWERARVSLLTCAFQLSSCWQLYCSWLQHLDPGIQTASFFP